MNNILRYVYIYNIHTHIIKHAKSLRSHPPLGENNSAFSHLLRMRKFTNVCTNFKRQSTCINTNVFENFQEIRELTCILYFLGLLEKFSLDIANFFGHNSRSFVNFRQQKLQRLFMKIIQLNFVSILLSTSPLLCLLLQLLPLFDLIFLVIGLIHSFPYA